MSRIRGVSYWVIGDRVGQEVPENHEKKEEKRWMKRKGGDEEGRC